MPSPNLSVTQETKIQNTLGDVAGILCVASRGGGDLRAVPGVHRRGVQPGGRWSVGPHLPLPHPHRRRGGGRASHYSCLGLIFVCVFLPMIKEYNVIGIV